MKSNKYTTWYKKQGLSAIKVGIRHKCSNGVEYPAIELSNGKTAVFIRNGNVLKYAF